MTVYDGVQLLCSTGTVVLVLLARDRLRMNAPKVRIALGGAGIILAISVFCSAMLLLPRPWEPGFSPFIGAMAYAACLLLGGLFVLSSIEIGGGTVQLIKRRRYYRHRVS
jgi:hypothetical protein